MFNAPLFVHIDPLNSSVAAKGVKGPGYRHNSHRPTDTKPCQTESGYVNVPTPELLHIPITLVLIADIANNFAKVRFACCNIVAAFDMVRFALSNINAAFAAVRFVLSKIKAAFADVRFALSIIEAPFDAIKFALSKMSAEYGIVKLASNIVAIVAISENLFTSSAAIEAISVALTPVKMSYFLLIL